MKKSTIILAALLLADIVFLVLHSMNELGYLKSDMFRTSHDGGYGEMFQYLKFITAAIVLVYLAKLMRAEIMVLWAMLAVFLFLDDWAQLHELVGGKMMGSALKPYVKGWYHQGQVVYGVIIATFAVIIGMLFWRRASAAAKALSMRLLLATGIIWVSAVLLDHVHAMWIPAKYNLPGVLLEEGGEHLGATLFVWFALGEMFRQRSQATSGNP